MKTLTKEQWWQISEYASMPVPLREANLEKPFLYVRAYGVFYVNFGRHQILMAKIQEWMEFGEEEEMHGIIPPEVLVERLLNQTAGVAWRSGVGKHVIRANILSYAERTYLKGVEYV